MLNIKPAAKRLSLRMREMLAKIMLSKRKKIQQPWTEAKVLKRRSHTGGKRNAERRRGMEVNMLGKRAMLKMLPGKMTLKRVSMKLKNQKKTR